MEQATPTTAGSRESPCLGHALRRVIVRLEKHIIPTHLLAPAPAAVAAPEGFAERCAADVHNGRAFDASRDMIPPDLMLGAYDPPFPEQVIPTVVGCDAFPVMTGTHVAYFARFPSFRI